MKHLEFIYIGDPMCSWCWGFAPVLDSLVKKYSSLFDFRMIVGGLRPGEAAKKLDDDMREFLKTHWQHVYEASGQKFDFEILKHQNWTYDTELPARAVVTIRKLKPELELEFFKTLQESFYAKNIDITNPEVYPELLADFDVDTEQFCEDLAESSKEAAWSDFAEARDFGIQGFPSLVIRHGEQYALLTNGYRPFVQLDDALSGWLECLENPADVS